MRWRLLLRDESGGPLPAAALWHAVAIGFMAKASQAPELAGLFTSWQVNVPQLYADIDRTRARQLGVAVTDVFDTMRPSLPPRAPREILTFDNHSAHSLFSQSRA